MKGEDAYKEASVRTYRQKPMTAESKEKVERSSAEILDLTERELRCPYCSHLIMTLFSDASGHLRTKCSHCKQITTYNMGYFRRVRGKRKREVAYENDVQRMP